MRKSLFHQLQAVQKSSGVYLCEREDEIKIRIEHASYSQPTLHNKSGCLFDASATLNVRPNSSVSLVSVGAESISKVSWQAGTSICGETTVFAGVKIGWVTVKSMMKSSPECETPRSMNFAIPFLNTAVVLPVSMALGFVPEYARKVAVTIQGVNVDPTELTSSP
jgi:hypothetical protein